VHTIVRGRFVFEDGKLVGEPGYGEKAKPLTAEEASQLQTSAAIAAL
jgi:hypothetical protein